MMKTLAISVALSMAAMSAAAQEAVKVSESAEHGSYLSDGDGRALYLFTADTPGEGDAAKVACTGECLEKWPPLYATGEPQPGEGVDAAKLDTIEHAENMMVTYNGWPLYYFFRDEQPGQTTGHHIESFGGEWYLVSPEGEKIGHD